MSGSSKRKRDKQKQRRKQQAKSAAVSRRSGGGGYAGKTSRWVIAGTIAALLAAMIPLWIYLQDRADVRDAATGNLLVDQSFHRDEPGVWRSTVILTNHGNGTAAQVGIQLTPTMSMCFGSSSEVCGSEMVSARNLPPEEVPSVGARVVDSESTVLAPGLYTATIRDFRPQEVVWFNFEYRVSSDFERGLSQIADDEQFIQQIEELLGVVQVSGPEVKLDRAESTFSDHVEQGS